MSQTLKVNFKTDLIDRCFKFSLNIIKLCDDLPSNKSANIIASQLIRSGTSIGANIIEGRAASSRLEFKKFYEISLKSANESIYWLDLLEEAGFANTNNLKIECIELSKMLGAGVIKLKRA